MNSRIVFGGALLAGLCASASVPKVENVTTTQDAMRKVTVTYKLSGEAGIVTLTAQTNRGDGVWVDVSPDNLAYVAGDVNKVVEPSEHCSLTWQPHKSWPDQYITGGNIRIGVKAWSKSAPPDYMVVSLVSSKDIRFYPSKGAIPGGVQDDKYKTDYLVMRKIPAAGVTWRMGSPATPKETGRGSYENPHEVTLKDDYYIGIYPVTQRQYERITGSNPATYKGYVADYKTRPVNAISYDTIRGSGKTGSGYCWPGDEHKVLSTSFMGVLRNFSGLNSFDLPTDAQWEFACRAGCGAALYDGTELELNGKDKNNNPINNGTSDNLARLARYANNGGKPGGVSPKYDCTADNATARVGTYEPNAWGIYDMLGNVWEWCLDYFQGTLTDSVDPEKGPTTVGNRVVRGGSFGGTPEKCRCANRAGDASTAKWDDYGFRVACQAVVE